MYYNNITSTYLSIYLSIYLAFYPFIYLLIYLFIYLNKIDTILLSFQFFFHFSTPFYCLTSPFFSSLSHLFPPSPPFPLSSLMYFSPFPPLSYFLRSKWQNFRRFEFVAKNLYKGIESLEQNQIFKPQYL